MVVAPSRRITAGAVAVVPAATIAANVTSYVLLLTAAHLLNKGAYGQLSSLLGLLLVTTVPMLALQTVAARRLATGEDAEPVVVSAAAIIGAGAAVLLALVSPGLAAFLHLSSLSGPLLVACTIPATALLGACQGIAQGQQAFHRLGLLIVLSTAGRSLGGLLGLLIGGTTTSTLLGVVLGSWVAAIGVIRIVRGAMIRAPHRRALSAVLREAGHASHGHGVFLLLTSLDVLLARHVLDANAAGVYAVGSVVTRAALWLPQSVVLLLFASLAQAANRPRAARQASVVVCAIGAISVAASVPLGALAVTIVGGDRYHLLDDKVWLFALLGGLLALLQLALLANLAVREVWVTALLWAAALTDVVLVLVVGRQLSVTGLVGTLTIVAGAAAAVGLWLTVRPRPPSASVPGRQADRDSAVPSSPRGDYSAAPVGQDPGM